MQYSTPFSCPECGEHTFETDSALNSEKDLVDASCTNCGHALSAGEIESQAKLIPDAGLKKMVADAAALNARYAGH